MKKAILIIILLLSFLNADIQLVQKGNSKHWCPISGLNLEKSYKTSLTAELSSNGRVRQYASMYALVEDNLEYGIDLEKVKVVDYKSEKLFRAKDAFFVVGSKTKSPLSKVSKIAFKKEADAKEHIKQYGGKLKDFQTAFNMAKLSYKKDRKILITVREKRDYKIGRKIFKKKCSEKIEPLDYIEINDLKSAIVEEKLCDNLKEKHLQFVSLYLWDIKRAGELGEVEGRVEVEENVKCPVCGMFVYKYPRWAAQIYYKHEDHTHVYSFDGVKDLVKFYKDPSKWGDYPFATEENLEKILVTDYYTQKGIDGLKAYYVIGSDIYGPMGHELIPFKDREDAETFKLDHGGTMIIEYSEAGEENMYNLDGGFW